MLKNILFSLIIFSGTGTLAQKASLSGKVTAEGESLPYANVLLVEISLGASTDESGNFTIADIEAGSYTLKASAIGYKTLQRALILKAGEQKELHLALDPLDLQMNEVVVSGTLKEVNRLETPVPVEVYQASFFKKNPTPTLFDAMQNINGVRPQLNCNVCNTGDIHINGLEGPYTMVLIDGMPIVSGLASVYGLSGIPNSMVERIEVVKGPASSLYGSEAVGGLINVITKNPDNAPLFSADVMASSWQEYNIDLGHKANIGSKASLLSGLSYFNYSNPLDKNKDGFTDISLQDRISLFQKWNFKRRSNRIFTMAGRYLYEDRWGGETDWNPGFRGGREVYGESIYTSRWELLGNYQLPFEEKFLLSVSYNEHYQDSYYGDIAYMADQKIAFSQLSWDKSLGVHDILLGTALRHTYYDDNTTATAAATNELKNQPDKSWLPGVFFQDELTLTDQQKLLLGMRYDRHSEHGNIWTPRLAYKYSFNNKNILRLNAGTGFRVVNLFTEEHAALTGSRQVVLAEALDPEQSININLNYIKKVFLSNGGFLGFDASVWNTYFSNQILPDYESDPNKILYDNLNGHAITRGVSLNMDFELLNGLEIMAGGTYMDVYTVEENSDGTSVKQRPLLTESWTGTWAASYHFNGLNLDIDYTGNFYGPMRLPLLSDLDPRSGLSPWWSLQNIQLSWGKTDGRLEVYGGIKNLLNFTPPANSIARSHDPFDKQVSYNNQGQVVPTASNPYALSFDPSYVYAPNQGIRGFAGIRYQIK